MSFIFHQPVSFKLVGIASRVFCLQTSLVGVSVVYHWPMILHEMSSQILSQTTGRGPEALGSAGVSGQGCRVGAPAVCLPYLQGEPTVSDSLWHSGYPWGFAARFQGAGQGTSEARA